MSLADAIERLRIIYDKQRRYPTTRDVLAKLLGYGGINGASATVLSALGKYGLLEGHGEQLRVSEMGQDLILHRSGDPEYDVALREAAFKPAFFRELRDQYPDGLPHEHSLRAMLIKRGFNPKVIDSAVRAYRDTIEFVSAETGDFATESLDQAPAETAMQTQSVDTSVNRSTSLPLPTDARQRSVQIPLSVNDWATLQAAFPLSEAAWEQMIAVLNAMKPALVAAPEPPSAPASMPSHFDATLRASRQDEGEEMGGE
jgi:hypothetical protein